MKTVEDLRSQPDLPDWMDYPQRQISFNGQQFLMTGLTSRDRMVRVPWGRNTFYELPMLKNIMTRTRNMGCFIDVGANLGNHSVFFANFCGAKCLYAVEAHPLICQVLKFNCKQHVPSSCPHTIFNYAASNQRGVLGVKPILPKNVGRTRVCKTDKGEIEIESRTLDELVGDEKIAFIKVDVEGRSWRRDCDDGAHTRGREFAASLRARGSRTRAGRKIDGAQEKPPTKNRRVARRTREVDELLLL